MKFKISYKLEVNNEKYERNFLEENSKHNVYKLTGRNELGKTTTLEVVAYAFGVGKSDTPTVNEYLRDKIKKFDSPNVRLFYNIVIEADDKVVELTSDETGKEYRINDEYVNSDDINNKFVIFFDVPEELYSKLKNSIENVGRTLNNYAADLNSYKDTLSNMYNQLKDFEQNDSKRDKLSEEIEDIGNQIENKRQLLNEYISEKEKKFQEYTIYKFNNLSYQFNKYDIQLKSIKKRINEYNSNRSKIKSLKSGDELRERMYDKKDYFAEYVNSEFTEQKSQFQKLMSQMKCLSNPSLLNEQIISSYYTFFEDLRTKLQDDIERYSNQPDIKLKRQELEMIQKLIKIVEEYSDINIEIPGANVKLLDILNPLDTRRDELKEFLQKNGGIDTKKSLFSDCNDFIVLLGNVSSEFKEYQNVMGNQNSNEDNFTAEDGSILQQQKGMLEAKLEDISLKLTRYEADYYNIPEEIRNTLHPQETIEKEYEEVLSNIEKVNDRLTQLNSIKKAKSDLLSGYVTKERPNMSLSSNEINNKIKLIEHTLQRIGSYANFTDAFAHHSANSINISDLEKPMTENIGRYMASILGYVYHNHKSYNIINIDFARKEYILEDNTPLSFNFIGRGTSALNSLIAKIEQPVGEKQKIILIDEIGDMDSENKQTLSNVLKKHSENKDSVLSLLTERNDNSTIQILSL